MIMTDAKPQGKFIPKSRWEYKIIEDGIGFEIQKRQIDGEVYDYIIPEKSETYLSWFEEYFQDIPDTYKVFDILPEKNSEGFIEDYKKFLYDNFLFLLSNSSESLLVPKKYMLNLGIKILGKEVFGKPYLEPLCRFGRNIEEAMLKTPEAQMLKEKYA